VISNKTEAAYRRQDQLEKRRKLMELWETYLSTPNQTASVTALTQAKAKNRA
jgi:hypothetical protein